MQENGLDQDAEGPEIGSEELEPHPACAAMPAMPWDVTRGLVEDIEANGLLEPIVIHGGQVLDGWHRLEACRKADVEPRFRRWDGECGTPERFALSKNLQRRHLSSSQRAMIAVDFVLPRLEEEARRRQAHGETAPGKSLADGIDAAGIPSTSDEKGRARHKAAKLVGVSGRLVQKAKRVAKHDDLLASNVRGGAMSLNEAVDRLKDRKIDAGHVPSPTTKAQKQALKRLPEEKRPKVWFNAFRRARSLADADAKLDWVLENGPPGPLVEKEVEEHLADPEHRPELIWDAATNLKRAAEESEQMLWYQLLIKLAETAERIGNWINENPEGEPEAPKKEIERVVDRLNALRGIDDDSSRGSKPRQSTTNGDRPEKANGDLRPDRREVVRG